jgi:hypothetical protein
MPNPPQSLIMLLAAVASWLLYKLLDEFIEHHCPTLAEQLVRWGIQRHVPEELRDLEIEILEILDTTRGHLVKIITALWIVLLLPATVRNFLGLPTRGDRIRKQALAAQHRTWEQLRQRLRQQQDYWRTSTQRLPALIRRVMRAIRRDRSTDRRKVKRARPPPLLVPTGSY